MEEIWKDIEGYEGKYQVSNTGKVKSLNFNNTGKEKELKQRLNRWGYLQVELSKYNKKRCFQVSTLVGRAFIPNNCPDKFITHISPNVTDNSVTNLKWSYRSELLHRTYKRGRRKGKPSENTISYCGVKARTKAELCRKLKLDYKLIRDRLRKGWTLDEAIQIPKNAIPLGCHAKSYKYKGKYYTIAQLSKLSDKSERLIRGRLYRGWSIDETIEIPKLY